MSQSASNVFPGLIESNQYLPLTACAPSLALTSLHDLAGNSGMEPSGTENQTEKLIDILKFLIFLALKSDQE